MRLDLYLVKHGHAASRERAKRLIEEGHVAVDSVTHPKPSTEIAEDGKVHVQSALPYVSRGGEKLEGALTGFGIDVQDMRCLDAGASTGGFTDCLLQHGASKIVAVDVGHGQMDPRIAANSRVELREGINARDLKPPHFDAPFDLAVADLSFIGLDKVLPAIVPLLFPGGRLLCLIKPQFEAGRPHPGKSGVIRDRKIHQRVLSEHVNLLVSLSMEQIRLLPSLLIGKSGNLEFWSASRRLVDSSSQSTSSLLAEQEIERIVENAHTQSQVKKNL